MNENTTTTTTTTAAKSANVGDVFQDAIVAVVQPFGALVDLPGTTVRGLLHKDQFPGGCNPSRKARLGVIKVGDKVPVKVLKVKGPKQGDAKGRDRYDLSARVLQEENVLASLKPATKTDAGTELCVTVYKVDGERGFALATVDDGVAEGYLTLLHASEMSPAGAGPEKRAERDANLAALQVGDKLTVEVKSVSLPKESGKDLDIKVSQNAAERRTFKSEQPTERRGNKPAVNTADAPTDGRTWKGQAIRPVSGGMEVAFGPMEAPFKGILPSDEVPGATKKGDAVRVKVKSSEGGVTILTRKGV